MRLAIFGATGLTGIALTYLALKSGHQIMALVRDPAKMVLKHPNLQLMHGNVLDAASVHRSIAGSQAVLSCLGIKLFGTRDAQSQGIKNILGAMKAHGVRRIVVESAYGVGESREMATPALRLVTKYLLGWTYTDKEIMESLLKSSDRTWTIVRPPQLRNGPYTGNYRVGDDLRLGLGTWIYRADVAEFMLEQLISPQWVGRSPAIVSAEAVQVPAVA